MEATGINPWFVAELGRSVALERRIRDTGAAIADPGDAAAATLLATAKRVALGDREIAALAGVGERDVAAARAALGLAPGFAMVDTCAAEFAAETPYFYSTYAAAGSPPEAPPVARPAALVIGSGPVRIGQGIEFDYCAVRAAESLRSLGWEAVMANSNPETVSTDFDASSRLYFEPLDAESVLEIVAAETASGAAPAAGLRPVRRPDAAQPCRRRSPPPGCRSWGRRSRRSTRPRTASASAPSSTASASPSRRAGWPARSTRPRRSPSGSATRSSSGRRSSSAASPSTSPTRATTSSPSSPRPPWSTPTGRCGSTAISRASRWTSTPWPTARRS